jgi:hypothetical protein
MSQGCPRQRKAIEFAIPLDLAVDRKIADHFGFGTDGLDRSASNLGGRPKSM